MKTVLFRSLALLLLFVAYGICGFAQNSATGTVTVTVVPAPVTISTPATLPAGTAGVAYSQAITATGGLAPLTCSIATQTAAASISGCILTWTPSAAGTFSVTVKVTDSSSPAPQSISQVFSLTIAAPALSVAPVSVSATAGVPWSVTLTAKGGVPPYTWLPSTTLPANVSLTPAGVLSGTFATPGTVQILIKCTDSASGVAHDITLTWTASISAAVVGYNVYRGTAPGAEMPTKFNSDLVQSGCVNRLNVVAGMTYYYKVRSVLADGTESADSLEASATVPVP